MSNHDLTNKTALELGRMIREGAITSPDCVSALFASVQKTESNCYISLFEEEAMEAARAIQIRIDSGENLSPLAGVPVALDDNICTEGRRTTGGSKMLENYIPTYSATVVKKLEEAGMIVVGKLNIDEFSMGTATETSFFGSTKHPSDERRVVGASGAAVASGEAVCAFGSDTGGALRQTSAQAGVCGLRPTYGTVSRLGLCAYASSMDQIGPIGRDMADVAALLNIVSGKDPADQTSAETEPIDRTKIEAFSLKGMRIGVPEEFLNAKTDPAVKNAFDGALEVFRSAGAAVDTFSFPELRYAVPAYASIACAEASTNLSRLDGIKYGYRSPLATTLSEVYEMSRSEGFGADAQRRIMLGNLFLSSGHYEEYYLKALKTKTMIASGFQSAFERFDVIVGSVSPSVAPISGGYKLLDLFESDFFTVPASLAGLPSASVPCAKDPQGLEIGLQIIGPHFSEAMILGAGAAYIRESAGRTGERAKA